MSQVAKLIDIDGHALYFAAVLDKDGVPTVPDEVVKLAHTIVNEYGLVLTDYIEGTFDYIVFEVDGYEEIDEDVAEQIRSKYIDEEVV